MKGFYDLTLDGEAFAAIKQDFNSMVARTLDTMQQKDVDSASITLKLEIDFPEGKIDDDSGFLFPVFKHKVSAAMQFKSEKSGYFGGSDYKLIWDRVTKSWKLAPIDSDQMSIDDNWPYEDDGEED